MPSFGGYASETSFPQQASLGGESTFSFIRGLLEVVLKYQVGREGLWQSSFRMRSLPKGFYLYQQNTGQSLSLQRVSFLSDIPGINLT